MNTPISEQGLQGIRAIPSRDNIYKPNALQKDIEAPIWKSFTQDAGVWFLFFFAIYLVLLLKVITFHSLDNDAFFGIYSLLISVYVLSRFLLSYLKKPIRYDPLFQPSVTFVVPAKNEEDNIAETIRRFAEVDYPSHKIEVVLINDGSTDRTLQEMQRAARDLRSKIARVEVIDWKINKGKREGMATGVKESRHDVVIFVDSDSFIDRDCVKHLTKYFADPAVGAVSGHTDVFNAETNLLTQMQSVRYYISFKIYKAAESVFGFVTCCPGCCSAYRRTYLMEFIDEWLSQKFLGSLCTYGDDRSLTNFIIRNYRAVYSEKALAHTVVPDTFSKYLKQQQRWKKSWVRETFIAATFMWKKDPIAAASFYVYMFLTFAAPIVFLRAMIWHPITTHTFPIFYLFGLFLMLYLHGIYYRLRLQKRQWFLAVCSFWFNSLILMWQLPWALLTIRDSRWGTR